MTQKTRDFFTDEQKGEAVNLVKPSSQLVSQVVGEMGLTDSALGHWSKQARLDTQPRKIRIY